MGGGGRGENGIRMWQKHHHVVNFGVIPLANKEYVEYRGDSK